MSVTKFYEGQYYLLSNFSAHKIKFQGEEYMTAEHAYQAAKFIDPKMKRKIREAPSAFLAREYGQSQKGRSKIFHKIKVMREIMQAKMLQHKDVKKALKSTGTTKIIKNHPDDYFWGTGFDGSGKNVMGKIWMNLR